MGVGTTLNNHLPRQMGGGRGWGTWLCCSTTLSPLSPASHHSTTSTGTTESLHNNTIKLRFPKINGPNPSCRLNDAFLFNMEKFTTGNAHNPLFTTAREEEEERRRSSDFYPNTHTTRALAHLPRLDCWGAAAGTPTDPRGCLRHTSSRNGPITTAH